MSAAAPAADGVVGQEQRAKTVPLRLVLVALAVVGAAAAVAALVAWWSAERFPDDTSAEAGFARDMATHHEQAVEMSSIIDDRTNDPLIKGLASDIVLTQQHQMGQMFGWLSVWGLLLTGSQSPMSWMGHPTTGRMPGMASPDEVAHLSELSGEAADREFLRLMIRHHEGGVPMEQAVLERSDRPEVRRLAESIVQGQQAEIKWMSELLANKGGGTESPDSPHADGMVGGAHAGTPSAQ